MTPLRVAAGVIIRGPSVLICQRRVTDRHPGRWEFPGGKIEQAESPPECVARELREELGIEADVGAELGRADHHDGSVHVQLSFWSVTAYSGDLRNLCFADVRWVAVRDLLSFDLLAADREFAARLPRLL